MRKSLLLIYITLLACQPSQHSKYSELVVVDTPIAAPVVIPVIHDTIAIPDTSCAAVRRELLNAKYKLNRIDFYLKICIKNKSQDKFLKGWIQRALK